MTWESLAYPDGGSAGGYRGRMGVVRRRWVESGGVRLAVFEWGDPANPPVVLVHGYPDDHGVWVGVAERLAARFHVVAYDVRGMGESTAPAGADGYRLAALHDDLRAVVDSLGGPVHLVGHDWGSVQCWGALDESRVRSFTSVSGPDLGHIGGWVRAWRRHPAAVLRQALRSWYVGVFQLPVLPELVWSVPWFRRKFGATRRNAVNGLRLYRVNRVGSTEPRRITVPVQQIAPSGDPYVTVAVLAAAEPWCDRLHRRRIVAGHWAPRTHPDAVARMITDFADHVAGAAPARELARSRADAGRAVPDGWLALVTGAGSGIGRATALALAEEGADVLCVDLDLPAAERTAAAAGGHALRLDVADGAAGRALADRVLAEFGVPDLVMANAGVAVAGPFLDTSEDDWRHVLDVNLWGTIHTLRAFLPAMAERREGGHVVITASAAGYLVAPSLPAYSTTKAAVLMLAQCLAGELAPAGIGVSAICPGLVRTNITETTRFAGTSGEEQRVRRARATAAYRRRGYPPEKVARAVIAAVRGDRVVVPVTPEARIGAVGNRVSPAATRAIGRWLDERIRGFAS